MIYLNCREGDKVREQKNPNQLTELGSNEEA